MPVDRGRLCAAFAEASVTILVYIFSAGDCHTYDLLERFGSRGLIRSKLEWAATQRKVVVTLPLLIIRGLDCLEAVAKDHMRRCFGAWEDIRGLPTDEGRCALLVISDSML